MKLSDIKPGTTTFARMREAAYEEMRDIEMSQDARIEGGDQRAPYLDMERRRNDLWGIVRLIDEILLDKDMAQMLAGRIAR